MFHSKQKKKYLRLFCVINMNENIILFSLPLQFFIFELKTKPRDERGMQNLLQILKSLLLNSN